MPNLSIVIHVAHLGDNVERVEDTINSYRTAGTQRVYLTNRNGGYDCTVNATCDANTMKNALENIGCIGNGNATVR